ncbi:hypothetical protein [Altererythrobacter sp. Root672]|uniref:hypothetical protein n=1 Tax=Altererythrobacter sp. Root672 TaxID=1736584 RepID=UPI000700BCE4|nr:hypothetical protein [Altererythrobacter sp. Root672]KRA83755.1 hypothetical protein ASD76_06980 [Altererythrobacter sp. Root672]
MTPDDDAKLAWQNSVEIGGALPLDEVRAGADKFYRFVRRRNLIEYVACAVAIVAFSAYVVFLPHVLQKIGSAMIVVGTVFAAWQLHRRASAVPPESAGTMPILLFSRAQLVRHRDALRSIFWWYILPFLPGLFVMSLGGRAVRISKTGETATVGWQELVSLTIAAVILGGLWWWNQRHAAKLQRHIDDIDALTGKGA